MELSGVVPPNPGNQCWPEPSPYTLSHQQGVQIIQQKDQVLLIYLRDQKVRHVRMNVAHSEHASYELDQHFGYVVDVLASVGCRTSQAVRLLVGDLQNGGTPRLMLPSSRKGGKGRKSVRRPVPITPTLAAKLRAIAAGRDPDEPLLTRRDGTAWPIDGMLLWRLFGQVAERLGINQSAYALRHSCAVRMLLAGTPVRAVAAALDTSTVQLEKTYSHFISDFADGAVRKGLIDTAAPATGTNVVVLDGSR